MGDSMTNYKLPITKIVISVLVIGALGFGIWKLGFSRPRDDIAWQRIRERGVWTVATDASYPPFAAVDRDGSLFGFDIDLAEEIGRRLGVKTEFENIAYDALISTLTSGRDDAVISAFVPQPARQREAAYTRPYFVGGVVAVMRREGGEPFANDPRAWMTEKVLAVEYGAGGDALARQWARRVTGIQILPKPTSAEALQAVEDQNADAALVDAISAYDFLRGRPALTLAGPPLTPEPYVIAVSANSRELLRVLEQTLAEMEADGTLTELKVKWFGEAIRVTSDE